MDDEKMNADDVLNLIGRSRFIFLCITICGFAWAPLALTGLVPAFIVKSQANSTFVSISDEFNLTGDASFLADGTTTSYMFGNMFGGLLISYFADQSGRRPVFLICLIFLSIAGLLSALVNDIYLLLVARFVHGFFYTAVALVGWVLGYENTPVGLRFFTSVYFGLTWVVGTCLLALIAFLSDSWRTLLVVISLPNLISALIVYLWVPESLHFLVSTQNTNELQKWLKKAKKSAKNPQILEVNAEDVVAGEKEASTSLRELLNEMWKHKIFIVYLVVLVYIWIVDTFIYFGLSFYAKDLAGSLYLNFVLMALVEAPAYVFAPLFMNRFGRKLLIAGSHVIAGLSFLAIILFSESLHLPFWLIGKFAISCSFMSIYMMATEIFPTDGRNKFIGFCETMSRIGGMLSPYLPALSHISPSMPAITLAVISVVAGILTLLLPETMNKKLPATISETASRRRLLESSEN